LHFVLAHGRVRAMANALALRRLRFVKARRTMDELGVVESRSVRVDQSGVFKRTSIEYSGRMGGPVTQEHIDRYGTLTVDALTFLAAQGDKAATEWLKAAQTVEAEDGIVERGKRELLNCIAAADLFDKLGMI
jgi:hypothetical protein